MKAYPAMLRQQSTIQGIQHLQKVASRHEVWRSNKTGTRENRQRTSRQMAPDRYGGAFPTNQKIPEDSVQRRKGTVLLQSGRTESRQTYYRLRICIAADLSPVRSLLPFPFAVRPISPERATDQAKPKGARVRERERERERERTREKSSLAQCSRWRVLRVAQPQASNIFHAKPSDDSVKALCASQAEVSDTHGDVR
jgi:hypothetical protein